jgi:hypothetical protein
MPRLGVLCRMYLLALSSFGPLDALKVALTFERFTRLNPAVALQLLEALDRAD